MRLMKLRKAVPLFVLAIVGMAVFAEIATSWYSERSGPFATLTSRGDVRNRQTQAESAIERFLEIPRTIDQTTAFLSQAGFTCRTGWPEALLKAKSDQSHKLLKNGATCVYSYGRYFMYPYKFFVSVGFDDSGGSAFHEIFYDF